eukprot:m.1436911 g.1436911  ORF g.1436911 m.1436911 type:complete len:673 (-) comp25085_c0_seq4:3378-5396(-)
MLLDSTVPLLLSFLACTVTASSFSCYDTALESYIVLPSCGSATTQYLRDLNSIVHTCNLLASPSVSDLGTDVFTCLDVNESSDESFSALQSINTSTTGRTSAGQALRNVVTAYLMNTSAAQSIEVVHVGYVVASVSECENIAEALTDALALASSGPFASCSRTTLLTTSATSTPTTTLISTQATTISHGYLQCDPQDVLFVDTDSANCSQQAMLINEIYFGCTDLLSHVSCTDEGFLLVASTSSHRCIDVSEVLSDAISNFGYSSYLTCTIDGYLSHNDTNGDDCANATGSALNALIGAAARGQIVNCALTTPDVTATTQISICSRGDDGPCSGGGSCAVGFPEISASSQANEVDTNANEFYYFSLPRQSFTCTCASVHFGPTCEFSKHSPAADTTVYKVQLLLLLRNQLLARWSYAKSAITELFVSRVVVHHVDDVNVTDVRVVGAGSGSRTARAVDASLAVYVNVTNIASASAAEVMRARLNALQPDTFPGFILARFLNASEFSVAVDPVRNETVAGSNDTTALSNNDDGLSTTIVVAASVTAGVLGLILLFCITVLYMRRQAASELYDADIGTMYSAETLGTVNEHQLDGEYITHRRSDPWTTDTGARHFYPSASPPPSASGGMVLYNTNFVGEGGGDASGGPSRSARRITTRAIEGTGVTVFADEPDG